MGILDELMSASGSRESNRRVLTAKETADVLIDFQPIPDLKVGDQVRRKEKYPNLTKGHDGNPVLTVARILPCVPTTPKDGNRVNVYDFTFLEIASNNGEIIEWEAESRLYERV